MPYYDDDGDEQNDPTAPPPIQPYGTQPNGDFKVNTASLGPALPPSASQPGSSNLDWKSLLQALMQKRQQQQVPGTGLSPSPNANGQLQTAGQIGSLTGALAKKIF